MLIIKKKSNKSNETKRNNPRIDILSQDFSEQYMNANHVSGYKNLMKTMNRKEVEAKFGKEEDVRNFLGREGHVYGNFMVMYYLGSDNPIEQYSIVPSDKVTYREFINFHGEPAQDLRTGQGHSFVTYNNTPNNGYQIAVYTSGNKDDDEIQYIMQYPDDFEFVNSSEHQNTFITRHNVFDAVEAFEGVDKVDTDNTTWKEPKKTGDTYGFSYENKDGKLLGSYNVREDGYVESFDEEGKKIRAAYIDLH
ncbi:hypothetical protein GCM10010896_03210 [Mammaliicoccus stepanovicii]|nr:hypothetical protein CD111_11750 [Mammaliicoccus stepanovicii]GGI39403.1 hypothetical protein GCM10010896_03210 [Mammaliicoccus stepanovicii]